MLKCFTRTVVISIAAALLLSACQKGPKQVELFAKAKSFQEQSNFKGAIDAYQEYVKRFPKSPEAPQCQFMIGYLYANHLSNLELAKKAYEDFIQKYPEHELVKDAQWELDHLGKDVNEIEELNKKLGTTQDTTKSVH